MATPSQRASTRRADKVPVVILNGFLGSGKTTLLRSLIVQASQKGLSISVVVNDMSELDVDGELVGNTDLFDGEGLDFESIHSCILSSQKGIKKLRRALANMTADRSPDLILIETSGSCHPMPLIQLLKSRAKLRLTGVLTLIDSAMLAQDYDDGRQIFPRMQHNVQNQKRDTTNLLVEQIMFCSHLILTKADRIEPGRIRGIGASVHALNPLVSVVSVLWGKLSLDEVLAMPDYDFHRVAQLVKELTPVLKVESRNDRPFNLATRVLRDDRPFHPQRLWETCHHHLGERIYRSKGFFWLAGRDQHSLLWSQAAGAINLELLGHWRAGVLEQEDHGLSPEEVELLEERLAEESGRFGDRHCHLTVIGDREQVDAFAEALRRCFLTEEEIDHWRSGGEFPDPWPSSLARISG
ncbi:MAG: GTP-binding protein [Acidobacteriota bacterium]